MKSITSATIAILLLGHALGAQGAPAQARQGFGISFGLGGGSAGVSCDGCSSDRTGSLSGYLRLGGYVNPGLFVGGESSGWVHNESSVDETISFLTAVVQWYPQPASGFYLKAGAGFSSASADDGFDEITAAGFGLTVGTGYDWRVTRNFSLTPYVNYLHTAGAELKANGAGTGFDANVSILQFGLGFTWH